MAVVKRVLCPERLRRVPQQFSWLDHRLVRDRHIGRCSAQALALYLFLVTVADGAGLSYYSDPTIGRLLPLALDGPALARARQELIAARLIAYQRPLYQVLALDGPAPGSGGPPSRFGGPLSLGQIHPVRANRQFRVTVDTNTYSVPAEYAGAELTLKLYPEHLCLYHQDKLIARHVRCYDRHQDFEDPDHPRALLQQRRRAADQKLLQRLLSLTPKAEPFYQGLAERRLNVLMHVRKIVALSEIYGVEPTRRALEDALEFQAFSCEYVANLLEQRQRLLPEPGALHLTRRQDLLELELPEPNLGLYDPACQGDAVASPDPDPPVTPGEPHEPEQGPQPDLG